MTKTDLNRLGIMLVLALFAAGGWSGIRPRAGAARDYASGPGAEYQLMANPQCPVCLLEADLGGENEPSSVRIRTKYRHPLLWCTRCGNLYTHRGVKLKAAPAKAPPLNDLPVRVP